MAAAATARKAARFEGKVALVTGGSNGIGTAIVRRFVEEGAKVAIADIDAERGARLAEELNTAGEVARFFPTNMGVEAEVEKLVADTEEWAGGVDVLVNNAAAFVFGKVDEVTEDDWDRILRVNVKGYAFAMKFSIPAMKRRGGGAIVNLASISSFIAQPGFVPYSTTKGAIVQMTRCTALDCGGDGIRVNAVCPGPILTEATARHAESQGKSLDDLVAEMSDNLILKRMGRPDEVAASVAFLASDDASYISGTTLLVDGGYVSI